MDFNFMSFVEDAGMLSLIVLIIELIKKYLGKEKVDALNKKNNFFTTLFILISIPVSLFACAKDGLFSNGNHWTIIVGWCFIIYISFAAAGPFLYDVLFKRLKGIKKKLEGGNE